MVIQRYRNMELETEHSLHSMIKELCAWCHMSRPACITDHNHKMGTEGKINIQIRFIFSGQKIYGRVQKDLTVFHGHRCP